MRSARSVKRGISESKRHFRPGRSYARIKEAWAMASGLTWQARTCVRATLKNSNTLNDRRTHPPLLDVVAAEMGEI